eukprot:8358306-Ditylum_brightwellii.AAC.1
MLVNFHDKFYAYQGATKGHYLLEEDVALVIGRVSKVGSTNWQATIIVSSQLSFGDPPVKTNRKEMQQLT